jgi:hypothetical protein
MKKPSKRVRAIRHKVRTRVALAIPGTCPGTDGAGLDVIFAVGFAPIGRVPNGTHGTVCRWLRGDNVGVAFDAAPARWGLVAVPTEWLEKAA